MLKFSFVFLAVFFFSISVQAVTGCVSANKSTIYTNLRSGTIYNSSTVSTPGSGCFYITTATACTIRFSSSNQVPGSLGDDTTQLCPIDDYIWVMMILFGGLGYYVLRKNALKLNFS